MHRLVDFVAVAVSAMMCTFAGMMLLISPRLANSRLKLSPLKIKVAMEIVIKFIAI